VEFVPVVALTAENVTSIEPGIRRGRLCSQRVEVKTLLGDDRPELPKALRPRFLMRFLCLARPIVGVAAVCATLDFNRNLLVRACRKLFLDKNVRIG
jgi:hypothetical protein